MARLPAVPPGIWQAGFDSGVEESGRLGDGSAAGADSGETRPAGPACCPTTFERAAPSRN